MVLSTEVMSKTEDYEPLNTVIWVCDGGHDGDLNKQQQ